MAIVPPRKNLPALAASQVKTVGAEMEANGAFPVNVFARGVVKEVAAFRRGQWYGSVVANPDGSGLLAVDESGKIRAGGSDPQLVARAALGIPPGQGRRRGPKSGRNEYK